jgi:hypothetical protein
MTARFLVVFVVVAGVTRAFLWGLDPTVASSVAVAIGGLTGGGATVAAWRNRRE